MIVEMKPLEKNNDTPEEPAATQVLSQGPEQVLKENCSRAKNGDSFIEFSNEAGIIELHMKAAAKEAADYIAFWQELGLV